jgi:hypothetical protein
MVKKTRQTAERLLSPGEYGLSVCLVSGVGR